MAVSIPWHPQTDWQPRCVLRKVAQDIPSSTMPSLVVTDAGNGYLKMPNNPQGPSALVSELVGTMLADWFELPTFRYALIYASPADLDSRSTDESEVPAFITKEEPGDTWKGTINELKRLSNLEVISRLVVFDTWVGNYDRYSVRIKHGQPQSHRNESNVFLSHHSAPQKLRIVAFDHTHCHAALISASSDGDIQGKIDDPLVYGNFPEFCELLDRNVVLEAVSKLSKFTAKDSNRVVESIPDEWVLSPTTRQRIADFATARAVYVASTIEKKLFPQGKLDL